MQNKTKYARCLTYFLQHFNGIQKYDFKIGTVTLFVNRSEQHELSISMQILGALNKYAAVLCFQIIPKSVNKTY